ncbi:MAG: esterase/lipase family protein [Candidatus Methylacidiphilales bacterium]|nr:alpha/beta hydrolase [Candidatus Methylacidiphilales bacterium]
MTSYFHSILSCLLLASITLSVATTSHGAENERIARAKEQNSAEVLARVEVAWKVLAPARAGSPESIRRAELAYNREVELFLVSLLAVKPLSEWKGTTLLSAGGRSYSLSIPAPPAGYTQWNITHFDTFRIASQVKIKSIAEPTRIAGIGAPLVLQRSGAKGEPFVYKTGYNCPGTAVIEFKSANTGPVQAVLRFYDRREIATAGGMPLAADYAAPVEVGLNTKEFRDIEFGGVFRIDKYMAVSGLYLTEPYRADKIPVVLVHGLDSSPLTWAKAINNFKSYPALAKKYQFWYYSYPTGTSWTVSAPHFRDQLNSANAYFASRGGRENLHRTILVGHSMGGLMARMACIDSGNDFWDQIFSEPPSQVKWPSAQARDTMMASLYFKKVPMVSAAIFVAAPHRGSGVADWFIVNFVKKLVKLPASLASTVLNVATLNTDGMKLTGKELASLDTSIVSLSPRDPAYIALNSRVIKVPFYTIIGDHDGDVTDLVYPHPRLLRSSDTIVPYWSAHLNQCVSEKIIHARHEGCTVHESTVDEVRRILTDRLAGKLGKAPTKPAGLFGPGEPPGISEWKHERVKAKAGSRSAKTN